MLRSREDAVDVVHALFADLIPSWTAAVDLPYLYRAVTNRCLNLAVGRVRLDDEVVGLGLIAALTERLDDAHLQVLVCRFVDDMTQDEIAAQLGVSRKTIGKRLDRIRDAVTALRAGEDAS